MLFRSSFVIADLSCPLHDGLRSARRRSKLLWSTPARAASMADVFLSYSKPDVADARMLAALLEANGYTVWWDTNLEGGEQFRKKIASELATARAVVVIWTKSSVASDWVQSEAGRALGDQKLVPIRSSEIGYKEIPPPFENRHTLKANQTEEILAAVAAQLAKPAAPGPWLMILRHELLLWAGVIGGAFTMMAMVSGTLTLSPAIKWILSNWSELLRSFWQALLFFNVEVSPYDAELLTVGLLMTSAVFYATSRRSSSAGQKSFTTDAHKLCVAWPFSVFLPLLTLLLSLFSIFVIITIGSFQITAREELEDAKDRERAVYRAFVHRPECAEILTTLFGRLGSGQTVTISNSDQVEIDDCLESALTTGWSERDRSLITFPPKIEHGHGSVWVPFLDSARGGWFLTLLFGAMLTPILLPFVLYLIVRSIVPLKLQVPVLSRRLWRTLALFGGILILNFLALKLGDLLKGLPAHL